VLSFAGKTFATKKAPGVSGEGRKKSGVEGGCAGMPSQSLKEKQKKRVRRKDKGMGVSN